MAARDIVVVGFSAGGIDPLLRLVGALPADFPGAVFVVHHFPPQSVSALPAILKRSATIPAAQAVDGEPIVPGRIYVARPDHHLLLEVGRVRLAHGPAEQGHRPAIDPSRSARAGAGVLHTPDNRHGRRATRRDSLDGRGGRARLSARPLPVRSE